MRGRADAGALAAALALEREQRVEQRLAARASSPPPRRAFRYGGCGSGHVDRLGLDERRDADDWSGAREPIDGPVEVRAAIAEVGAEGDGDEGT